MNSIISFKQEPYTFNASALRKSRRKTSTDRHEKQFHGLPVLLINHYGTKMINVFSSHLTRDRERDEREREPLVVVPRWVLFHDDYFGGYILGSVGPTFCLKSGFWSCLGQSDHNPFFITLLRSFLSPHH